MELLLFVVHLRSQSHSEINAKRYSQAIYNEIDTIIKQRECQYVIIIGDFNLPNYEDIFLNFFLFNATNYYSEDSEKYKIYDGKSRLKYYSPISSLQGDLSNGPPGTYHYNIGSQSQAWHTYDQALISYPLARYLKKTECCVLTEIGNTTLLTKYSKPNKKFSDHLPIKIEFI